ncbi:tyrosine-protein phosphatase 69D isoform X1 [Anopheles merus]|uniref:protein-tyrosine-phosphatase n=1 Tax=Anopheles merus TaxID=30066 RepID=A0A182UQ71_ANOME|nr:tyrosine-protein phosphatase 69D isoform X1 [Anopheles merus]
MWKKQAPLCWLVSVYVVCQLVAAKDSQVREEYFIAGSNGTLSCATSENQNIVWQKNGANISNSRISFLIVDSSEAVRKLSYLDPADEADEANAPKLYYTLTIHNFTKSDEGNYTCYNLENGLNVSYTVRTVILPKITQTSNEKIRTKTTSTQQLYCVIEAFPLSHTIYWVKEDASGESSLRALANNSEQRVIDERHVNATLTLRDLTKGHNGTYSCVVLPSAQMQAANYEVKKSMALLILDVPQVTIDYAKAVGANKIYLNWTVNDGNDRIKNYIVRYLKTGDQTFTYYREKIGGNNSFYVLDGFEPGTDYKISLGASNGQGDSKHHEYSETIRTLDTDPSFTPEVEVKGSSHSTITIGWAPPPANLTDYIQYYELVVSHAGVNDSVMKKEAFHPQNSRNLPYMFDNLATATTYNFRVRACSELTKICGNWSDPVNGTTSDGQASAPRNLQITCSHHNISRRNFVRVRWEVPEFPNGKIMSYQAILSGVANYRSEFGMMKSDIWGPKIKNINPDSYSTAYATEYDNVPPNTNYTVNVTAHTRTKRPGVVASATCTMPATTPDNLGRISWGKLRTDQDDWIFKLFLPRLSERNGPICCYKVYLTRIHIHHNGSLPAPENALITSYADVHSINNTHGGTYLAEVFAGMSSQTEVFLGDGKNSPAVGLCPQCLQMRHRVQVEAERAPATTELPAARDDLPAADDVTAAPGARTGNEAVALEDERKASSNHEKRDTGKYYESLTRLETVFDGALDPTSNYTGFLEVVVKTDSGNDGRDYLSTFSEYFQEMNAGAPMEGDVDGNDLSYILNIVIQVLLALIAVVVIVLMVLCFLHKHVSNNIAQEGEAISLGDSLRRALCNGGRGVNVHHRHLLGSSSAKPPVLPPISKDDLPKAYNDKHKDSDYGFQHEFELLPDKFADRTTKNSDMKENMPKNRYPDIKAYDQTRVKLTPLNGLAGSDYINANFVIGYKERKKFICAQGPMDATINDFWRMIWEQHLEIIVMLTNLEEYNKTKCAKYWPETTNDSIQYGELLITFQSLTYYADYIIRTLKVTKRSASSGEETSREISQYHYLAWKDFMAPEHPQGITKFINRINSEYSLQRGPILVHCSAGVGRTGTFVALDTLMQQLQEEGQVFIFNTICDMRYQRNFLVQSLKQYIFLYRALAELAYFGDTEIDQKSLASTIEALKQPSSENVEISRLELQFQRLKAFQEDTRKTTTMGSSEENKAKNRSESCIPYDKNRVILAPIPGRDNCTYINASFIDGYDDENNFVITQDPMEDTIFDFWRMIFEQRIKTIVMFSEIGDGPNKCPRYWADEEMKYENLLVSYIQSESGPYYTKREFTVTNCKTNDTIHVTQFQYNGWPTVEGEVPEVTRGMIEIVNQAQKHSSQQQDIFTIAVHCSLGTDKSSLFVAMCILVMQLKTEKRVDICTVVRKLRAQRSLMIQTYAQYEFLHRAIVNFADLYKISLGIVNDC